jgi:hypothetical protein
MSRAFIEVDFFGSAGTETTSNSHNPRLRHAFGELGRLTAGQTWTTFMDVTSIPEVIDFEGPAGEIFVRQPLVRYTHPFEDGFSLAAALEHPEGDISGAGGLNVDRFPDGVLRGRWEQDWGHLQVGGLVREINLDDTQNTLGIRADDTAVGYAFNVSGQLKVGKLADGVLHPKDNVKFQVNYGDGVGRYITDLGAFGNATGRGQGAVMKANGNLDTIPVIAAQGSFQHWWTDTVRSTAVVSYLNVDNQSAQSPNDISETYQANVNLIWSPVPWVDLGAEFLFGRGETKGGEDATGQRIQAAARFSF